MRNIIVYFVALLVGIVAAVPITPSIAPSLRRRANIDIDILQFALTLEHLENIFYKEALLAFSQKDFEDAGFGNGFFEKLLFIAFDEQSHVQLLSTAIAATNTTPVAACTYNFPFTDIQSFVTLSSVLEGVGTSAYLGAAALVTDKTILTVAASIMVTEALHTSQQRGALNVVPAANSLGTPLGANAVFTLAASFIVSCPAGNPTLPFSAFPPLAIDTSSCSGQQKGDKQNNTGGSNKDSNGQGKGKGNNSNNNNNYNSGGNGNGNAGGSGSSNNSPVCPQPQVGETVTFTSTSAIPSGSFVTFVSGLTIVSVQATITDVTVTIAIPTGLGGQTYVFITNNAVTGTLVDQDILMGPAIMEVVPTPPLVDNSVSRGVESTGSVQ